MSEPRGNYEEQAGVCEYLTLAFSPISAPLRSRWRNNGLSADFLGDYVTTFLPVPPFANRQKEIKHAVAYIANELLENAMKYHQPDVEIPIRIHLALASGQITVSVSNGVSLGQAESYKAFVEHLQQGDAGDLLARQQEESARSTGSAASGLGLLTIVSDYDAHLDVRFDIHPTQPQSMTVTTSAVLPLQVGPGASA